MRYAVLFSTRTGKLTVHAPDCPVAAKVALAPGKDWGADSRQGLVRTDAELGAPTQAEYDRARGDDTAERGLPWSVCKCAKRGR